MTWVALKTKPRSEFWAAENVSRQGLEYYLPRVQVSGKSPDAERVEPLFPTYLFVRIIDQWIFLRSTFGVQDVVMRGDLPATLSEAEIGWIRGLENDEGLVALPDRGRFSSGEHLRVRRGPFAELSGVCDGMKSEERVYVLLRVLGGETRVEIPVSDVTRD